MDRRTASPLTTSAISQLWKDTPLRYHAAPSVLERFEKIPERRAGDARDIAILKGKYSDYAALARFHYIAGPPATCVRVLTAIDTCSRDTAGVLIVSVPTLNARWRKLLWGERFSSGNKKRDAAAVNESLRTISRVVVDPRYRGLGLATRLVRAYLAQSLTPATEAVAAMGWVCPFFECAGMRAINLQPSARALKLARTLKSAGIPAWKLMEAREAEKIMRSSDIAAIAVRAWMRSGTPTKRRAAHARPTTTKEEIKPWHMAVLAASSIGGHGVAYGAG